MKTMVILTKPVDGIENKSDETNVIGSIENPNIISVTKAGVKSSIVDHPVSWNANKVMIKINAVIIYVAKSKMKDVNQKVDTFNPLTNCKSLAFETLSRI